MTSSQGSLDTMLTCTEFIDNITSIIDSLDDVHDSVNNVTDSERNYQATDYVVNKIAAPLICTFGIGGNLLNLLVLTRKRLQCSMDRMEKSAHVGLVALALSDLFFCLFYLLTLVCPIKSAYVSSRHWMLGLYYSVYKEASVNTFALTSTWLTVVMAFGRYIVVCRPLHARGYISLRGTKISIAAVILMSILLNVPRMMKYEASPQDCVEIYTTSSTNHSQVADEIANCSCAVLIKDIGWLYRKYPKLEDLYDLTWFTVANLIPLVILTACNVCLIRALRQSRRLQMQCRANMASASVSASAAGSGNGGQNQTGSGSAQNRITPTLIALIVVFTVCVGPSGVVDFFEQVVVFHPSASSAGYYGYQTANVITNCLFLVNFAVNFVLYCVVNVQFRRIARDIICCVMRQRDGLGRRGRSHRGGNNDVSVGLRTRSSVTGTACSVVHSTARFESIYLQPTATASPGSSCGGRNGRLQITNAGLIGKEQKRLQPTVTATTAAVVNTDCYKPLMSHEINAEM